MLCQQILGITILTLNEKAIFFRVVLYMKRLWNSPPAWIAIFLLPKRIKQCPAV